VCLPGLRFHSRAEQTRGSLLSWRRATESRSIRPIATDSGRHLNYLAEEIRQPGPGKGVMPGVCRLLDALAARGDTFLALLTGNFEAGARLKLEYFDLWRYFSCGAYGDEAHERTGLWAPALAQVAACGLPVPRPEDIVVVGDTPLDVAVATAGGARSVGVSTGGYDVQALRESGADVVLEDFSDLDASLDALGLGRIV
jgi:phosphoglycolate phosphatase